MLQQYITNTQRQRIMSSAGILTPRRHFLFEKLNINQILLPCLTKPQNTVSHQPQSGEVVLWRAPTLPSLYPIAKLKASVLSVVSTTGGKCMMGVIRKTERQREVSPPGWHSSITWFCSMSSVFVPVGWKWTHIRNLKKEIRSSFSKFSQYLQSCRRLWNVVPDVLTLPRDHPVFLLSPRDFPLCCAAQTKCIFVKIKSSAGFYIFSNFLNQQRERILLMYTMHFIILLKVLTPGQGNILPKWSLSHPTLPELWSLHRLLWDSRGKQTNMSGAAAYKSFGRDSALLLQLPGGINNYILLSMTPFSSKRPEILFLLLLAFFHLWLATRI